MTNFRRTALAGVINLALLGATNVHAADTDALEKRIHELESRLAKMDQLERRLEKLDQAAALSAKPAAVVTAPAAPSPEVVKLTQKVNTLERKLEVQDEVTTTALQKMPTIEAGSDGFKISSADKQHLLHIGGTVQADSRSYLNNSTTLLYGANASKQQYLDNPAGPDAFLIRQGRIILDGYFFKDVNFKVMADFANTDLLPDAYLDYIYFSQASLLVGKYKPSIGLERLQGDADTVFLERALPSNLAPNRDVGIQIHGGFGMPGYKGEKVVGPIDSKNAFNYQIGFSDGSGDSGNNTTQGTSSTGGSTATITNNKEFDARAFAQPFQHSGYSWLEGFGVGLSGSFGDPNHQGINTQRTALGQSQFVDYTKGINGSTALITSNGATARLSPQGYWYAGPFGLLGEYITSSQHLNVANIATAGSNNNINQNNKAYQIQASYVLTGEDNSFSGIKPLRNFDPLKGAWGAFQIAARWSELSIDNQTFSRVLDPTQSASKASAWTVGGNWFLNKNAIIRADLEDVMFLGGAGYSTGSGATTKYFISNRPSELVFSTRFQLAF